MLKRMITVLGCLVLVGLPVAASDEAIDEGVSHPDGDAEASFFDPSWFCTLASTGAILTCFATAEAACGEAGTKVVSASASCGVLVLCHWECNEEEGTSDQA